MPSDYGECLKEVNRVLKPGGTVYFDAPIYFHGHEMFIANDLPRIRALFCDELWLNVKIEKWRQSYEPLERYAPSDTVLKQDWPVELVSYSADDLHKARDSVSVYMIAITAEKRIAC